MSYQRPGADTRTSGLSITSLFLAVLLPLVGVVVGLVARATAKRAGGPTTVATVAVIVGAVLSVLWTVVIALFLWAGATFAGQTIGSGSGSDSAPPAPGVSVEIEVRAQDGLDDQILEAARSVIERQAASRELDVVTAVGGEAITVTFREGESEERIAQFTASLTSPLAGGFYAVVGVAPGNGGSADDPAPSCTDLPPGGASTAEGAFVCDAAGTTRYLIDSEPRVPGTDIAEVMLSGDVLAVTLSQDGASELGAWTAEIAPSGTAQIAIVDASGVISAPVVAGAISGGEFQISGGSADDLEDTADRLRILGAGVTFRVDDATAG